MKVNTKIRYGLRMMIVVANNPDGILQKDIAREQDISIKYLDSIIPMLKLKGLIVNVGGKGSGYKLSRPANEITMYDIYTAFETVNIVDCVCNPDFCHKMNECNANKFWGELKNDITDNLKKKRLIDIL